jgi:protein-S-isoprenylcysteine O-methyltransferase Ste14
MLFKFIDKFINRYRYLEVIILFVVYSFLFFYYWESAFNNFLGLFLFFVGLIFWIKSLKDIGPSFSASAKAKKLVTTGMYSKFRHPIYYSGILMDIGLVISTLKLWIFLIVFVIFLIQLIRIHREEKILIRKFGKRYIEYKKRTLF